MAQVLDLRGRQLVRDRTPVLLDPSGGRARVLAWTGRGVAVVFLLWLIGLVFAGLGLLPSGSIPLGRALVGQSPPPIKGMPLVTQPGFADPSAAGSPGAAGHATATLAAGGTVASSHAAAARAPGFTAATSVRHNHPLGSPARPGHGHAPVAGTVGAGSGATTTGTVAATPAPVPAAQSNNGVHAGSSGPGRTTSQSSPGHTKPSGTGPATGTGSSNGSSGNGHQTTTSTTTTPGKSGSAPGHASVG